LPGRGSLSSLGQSGDSKIVAPTTIVGFKASSCFQEPAFALTAGLIAARDLTAVWKLASPDWRGPTRQVPIGNPSPGMTRSAAPPPAGSKSAGLILISTTGGLAARGGKMGKGDGRGRRHASSSVPYTYQGSVRLASTSPLFTTSPHLWACWLHKSTRREIGGMPGRVLVTALRARAPVVAGRFSSLLQHGTRARPVRGRPGLPYSSCPATSGRPPIWGAVQPAPRATFTAN